MAQATPVSSVCCVDAIWPAGARSPATPVRVFSRDELARCIWRGQISGRTVDSHLARMRTRLTTAGANGVLINNGDRLVAHHPAVTASPCTQTPGHASYQLGQSSPRSSR
jgi:hypothetical protein